MKLKNKALLIIYIVAFITIAIMVLNNIWAASGNVTTDTSSGTISFGSYVLTKKSEEMAEPKTYDEVEQRAEYLKQLLQNSSSYIDYENYIFQDDLDKEAWLFCCQKNAPLQYSWEYNSLYGGSENIYDVGSEGNKDTINALYRDARVSDDLYRGNIQPEGISGGKGYVIVNKGTNYSYPLYSKSTLVGYSQSYDSRTGYATSYSEGSGYYYSRRYVTTRSTKVEDFDTDDIKDKEREEQIKDWTRAYILAVGKNEKDGKYTAYEKSDAQKAFWALEDPDKYSYNGQLLAKAKEFAEYKVDHPNLDGIEIKDNGKYEYVYNAEEKCFIAGPINLDCGALPEAMEDDEDGTNGGNNASNNDDQKYELQGVWRNGEIKVIDKKDYKLLDSEGNEIDAPESGKEFYIKLDNSKPVYKDIIGLYSFSMELKVIDIHVKAYSVSGLQLEYSRWIKNGNGFIRGSSITGKEAQNVFMLYQAEISYDNYDLEIYFGSDNPPPSDTPSPSPSSSESPDHPTYIDVAGMVWIDGNTLDTSDKSSQNDNKYYSQKDGQEHPRKNVLVKLYVDDGSEEGTQVKTGVSYDGYERVVGKGNTVVTDLKTGATTTITDNSSYGILFQTYTDEDGKYVFKDLPFGPKYFVKFTYDGMKYEPVKYLDGKSESEYKKDPNSFDKSYKVSKVNDEDEEEGRKELQERFKTITGYWNTAYKNLSFDNERSFGSYQENDTISQLVYKTKKFGRSKVNESRLLTTRLETNLTVPDDDDVEFTELNKPEDGVVWEEKYQVSARSALTYPFYDDGDITIYSKNEDKLKYLKEINLGLKRRIHADLRVSVATNAGAISIKGRDKVVQYENYIYDIDVTKQQDQFIKQEIAAADYNWKDKFRYIYDDENNKDYRVEDTQNGNRLVDNSDNTVIFDSFNDQLRVYVLYTIKLVNESTLSTDIGQINKLVDYYDNNLELLTIENNKDELEKAYKLFKESATEQNSQITSQWPTNATNSWMTGQDSKQSFKDCVVKWNPVADDQVSSSGYTRMDATFDGTENKEIYLTTNVKDIENIPTIYLIFKVKNKENDPNFLYTEGEKNRDGMTNVAEIASYSILNENGEPLGKVDQDSAPLNAIPGERVTYEDDADAGALFRLDVSSHAREIKGTVWEDKNYDGLMNDPFNPSEDNYGEVKVDLIEWLPTGKSIVRPGWKMRGNTATVSRDDITRTDSSGNYEIYTESGNYQLQFTFGDDNMLQKNVKYNAQDYRVTKPYTALTEIYKDHAFFKVEDIPNEMITTLDGTGNNVSDEAGGYVNWDAIWDSLYTGKTANTQGDMDAIGYKLNNSDMKIRSSAREDAEKRAAMIQSTLVLLNDNAELLHYLNNNIGDASIREKLLPYTEMQAKSDIVVFTADDMSKEPTIINMGLKEREKSSVQLKKEVERIVITTSDGTVIIDTDDLTKVKNIQQLGENGHPIDETFINLDASIMDGALADFYYNITVTNDAEEEDKVENYVYIDTDREIFERQGGLLDQINALFETNAENRIGLSDNLPIRINKVFDYAHINLEFRAVDNALNREDEKTSRWTKIYDNGEGEANIQGYVNEEVRRTLPRINNKISKVLVTTKGVAENTIKNLYVSTATPGTNGEYQYESKSVANIPIHLGITLAENTRGKDTYDTIFSNCAEIVEIYSGAGRRDYDTVPGNYVPYSKVDKTTEMDADLTGSTAITPPLGSGDNVHYYLIAIGSVIVIAGGIILIKKKFLK